LDALETDDRFAARLLPPGAIYSGAGTGAVVRAALVADKGLRDAALGIDLETTGLFRLESEQGRRATLTTLMVDVSVTLTAAMFVANGTGYVPVVDDVVFARLLDIRLSSQRYLAGTSRIAPLLGLELMRSVLPDDLLSKLEVRDVLAFRESSKAEYDHFAIELNRVASKLDSFEGKDPAAEFTRVVIEELAPRIHECRIELENKRDRMFANILKQVATWQFPTLSCAYIASLTPGQAIAASAAALVPLAPHLIEYATERRRALRRDAMSYIIGLQNSLK